MSERTVSTTAPTSTGTRTDTVETAAADVASTVDTSGLAAPAVVTVEAPRVVTVRVCTAPAAPPPATMASVHFRNGLMSVTQAAATTMPATTAAGVATESSRLSSHGT
jgi:hypothetical protein